MYMYMEASLQFCGLARVSTTPAIFLVGYWNASIYTKAKETCGAPNLFWSYRSSDDIPSTFVQT